jgi:hypothetical protein
MHGMVAERRQDGQNQRLLVPLRSGAGKLSVRTMQANRILGIVVLLLVAVGAAVWFVSRGDGRIDLPTANEAQAAAAAGATADAATGTLTTAAAAERAADATLRVEAASATAAPEMDAAMSGQVVDDAGHPVVGAVVKDSRGSAFEGGSFDGDFFEAMADDPEAVMASVRAARREGVETTTDAEGRFRLGTSRSGGKVTLRVAARGHRVLTRSVARPTKGDLDVGVLQLERGAIISGRVVDRAGNGIADATVAREPGGQGTEWLAGIDVEFPGADDMPSFGSDRTKTDAQGRFELPHAGAGEFALRARHAEHPSQRQTGLSIAAGETMRDVLLVLEPGASIRGRVVGVPDGARALRVVASSRRDGTAGGEAEGPFAILAGGGEMFGDMAGFGERSAQVEADGGFVLRGLHIGRVYRVWATQSGRGVLGNATCSERLEVTTPIEGIELRYEPGITVTFQVKDDATGEPIERLWVRHALTGGGGFEEMMSQAMARSGRPTSYPDGLVTIANLRPTEKQALTLTVEAIGFREHERKGIALPRRGELDLGVVRLTPAPALRLQVLSQADGTPVVGATVRVRAEKSEPRSGVSFEMFGERMGGAGTGSARTDDEGRCVVNAPTDTPFVAVVTSKEHARHETAPLTLGALAGREHVVRLLRGGTVEVTAVDADGAIAASQRVEHMAPDGSRDNKTTNDTGIVSFERLAPGEHRFRIGDRAGGPDFMSIAVEVSQQVGGGPAAADAGWQPVQVDDGAVAAVRLVKPASAQLRGVVRENGLPLADARIAFLKGAGGDGLGADLAEMMAGFGGGAGGRSTRAGDDGSYLLRDLPEGSHRLRITSRERTMPAIVTVELRAAENVLDIDLDVATVRGVVRDAAGQPLADAKVRVTPVRSTVDGEPDPMAIVENVMPGGMDMLGGAGGGRSTKTDGSGRYELRGVQAGAPLQVRATAKGHAPAVSTTFEVPSGGTRDGVDLAMLRAGRIKVTMAEKAAFVFASANLLDAGGENDPAVAPVMQMLRNGAGTLDGLQTGRWRVSLRMPNGEAPSPRDVDVVAGETVTVAF